MSILIQLSLLMSNRDNARVHNQNWVREGKKGIYATIQTLNVDEYGDLLKKLLDVFSVISNRTTCRLT